MLGRRVGADTHPDVARHITLVTVGRLVANAAYRYSAPFLATIAGGLHLSVSALGVALAIAELTGLAAPIVGRMVERIGQRLAMGGGLFGIAAGCLVAAGASGRVVFGLGLLIVGLAKSFYDIGLGSWIAGYVPYERRGRVVGLTETSWALGLLVGVSIMGVVTDLFHWRAAFAVAAAALILVGGILTRTLAEPPRRAERHDSGNAALRGPALVAMIGMFGLAAAAQALFVTFGSWLEDDHGFRPGYLAAVTFALGGVELAASLTAAHRTDRWGKERSVLIGSALMIPGFAALMLGHRWWPVGLAGVFVAIVAFEFAIVSGISLASGIAGGSAARGIAWMVGATALGRAVAAAPATRLLDQVGIRAAAAFGAALALIPVLCFWLRLRRFAR